LHDSGLVHAGIVVPLKQKLQSDLSSARTSRHA
jgi:hypothetical protein